MKNVVKDTIVIKEHDKNQLMAIMHQIMDKMKAMQMSKEMATAA